MRTINVTTAQKISISYELAELKDRIMAYVIDNIILTVVIIIFFILGQAFYLFFTVLATLIFFFYTPLMEMFFRGQSIGKMALRIRVISISENEPTVIDYLNRGAFRAIDIFMSFGALASLLISSSEKRQRLGDIFARTAVVKVQPSLNFTLKDILNIHSQKNYQPQYRQVTQLAEKDLLTVKNVLERQRKYNNKVHKQLVEDLANRMQSLLGIEERREEAPVFLQTLIKDYIVLTR